MPVCEHSPRRHREHGGGAEFLFKTEMSDQQISDDDKPRDLDQEQARLAYTIIESLLEHTRVVSDLIALMAQTLDQDTTKALTQTPVWTAYLDSRRAMERTRAEVEKLAEIMKSLSEN